MSKRSGAIEIGFVSIVAAAALSGCNPEAAYHRDWQQCVDQRNVVVDDKLCDRTQSANSNFGASPYYHWWYSPTPFYMGQTMLGGYATPRANMQVARTSTVSRGGFGSSAHEGVGG